MSERGSGRTTRQINEAPKNAVFICPPGAWEYTMHLARHLGRPDLEIRRPDHLDEPHRLRGLTLPGLVIDHAVTLTERQWAVARLVRIKKELER